MSKSLNSKDISHTIEKKKPYQIKDSNRRINQNLASTSTTSTSSTSSTSNEIRTTQSTKPITSKGGRLKVDDHLDLSKSIITITPSLISYTNLHKLNLMECGLKQIGFVKEVKLTLTWLNVSGNDLSGKNAWDGVEELTRLFVLNASNCSLKAVPSIVESLHSLKALVISHNSLTSLTHIKSLANLNTLVVSNNKLTSLPESLTTLPLLKKISAAHNLLTPSTLPDLSINSQLKEIKFNDNPHLSSLPSHFKSWGKGSLGGLDFKGKRKTGLEIVDLGACGFKDWSGLRELAGQESVVNLGLKGNVVAEEAKVEGFEEFRNKITILLPALRILDGQRFDPKFFDLKAKRALRPADQKIVDSGPMGLAINALASEPIEVSKEVERRRKRKLDLVEVDEETERELKEVKRKKLEEKEERRRIFEEKERKLGVIKGIVGELKKKKLSKKGTVDEVEKEAEKGEDVEMEVPVVVVKKEKKNKKAKLAEAVAAAALALVESSTTSTIAVESIDGSASASAPASTSTLATTPIEPLIRKRGRKSAHISTLTTPLIQPPRTESSEPKMPRPKKLPGGMLSALKGTEAEQKAEKEEQEKQRNSYVPSGANAVVANPADEIIQKEKTSILKVVEVKRSKKEISKLVSSSADVESLMLGKKDEVQVGLGGWD